MSSRTARKRNAAVDAKATTKRTKAAHHSDDETDDEMPLADRLATQPTQPMSPTYNPTSSLADELGLHDGAGLVSDLVTSNLNGRIDHLEARLNSLASVPDNNVKDELTTLTTVVTEVRSSLETLQANFETQKEARRAELESMRAKMAEMEERALHHSKVLNDAMQDIIKLKDGAEQTASDITHVRSGMETNQQVAKRSLEHAEDRIYARIKDLEGGVASLKSARPARSPPREAHDPLKMSPETTAPTLLVLARLCDNNRKPKVTPLQIVVQSLLANTKINKEYQFALAGEVEQVIKLMATHNDFTKPGTCREKTGVHNNHSCSFCNRFSREKFEEAMLPTFRKIFASVLKKRNLPTVPEIICKSNSAHLNNINLLPQDIYITDPDYVDVLNGLTTSCFHYLNGDGVQVARASRGNQDCDPAPFYLGYDMLEVLNNRRFLMTFFQVAQWFGKFGSTLGDDADAITEGQLASINAQIPDLEDFKYTDFASRGGLFSQPWLQGFGIMVKKEKKASNSEGKKSVADKGKTSPLSAAIVDSDSEDENNEGENNEGENNMQLACIE